MSDLQVHIENKIVPIDTLIAHRRNYRNHPDAQISQLETSYRRFGQFRSVVARDNDDGTYTLLAGHGIVEAMRRENVVNVRIDALPSSISEDDAIGIMIADNNLNTLAVDDSEALAALLQEQQNAGYALEGLGSDDESLRQMLEELGDKALDFEPVGEDEQGRLDEKSKVECPECGHVFEPK